MKKHIAGLFGFALLLAAASAHAQLTKRYGFKCRSHLSRRDRTCRLRITA